MRSVSFTLGVVLCAGLVLLSAQGTNPRIGTWQNNVAKSKYDPGPAPKSQTLKIEAAGEGEKVISETVTADGSKATSEYTWLLAPAASATPSSPETFSSIRPEASMTDFTKALRTSPA